MNQSAITLIGRVAQSRTEQNFPILTSIFVVLAIGLMLMHMAGLAQSISPVVAALAILILGVPHGGFDVAIATQRFNLCNRISLAWFLTSYIALAAAFLALWVVLPEAALPVFLMLSAVHFSGDWEDPLEFIPRLIIGGGLITAPALFHREQVTEIFSWLVPADVAKPTATMMAILSIPLLQAALVVAVLTMVRNRSAGFEVIAVLLLATTMPPLVFFIVYFCALHSPRHMVSVYQELRPDSLGVFIKQCLPYTPLAIGGTLIGSALLGYLGADQAILSAVFLALAALTVPHMLLIDLRG